MTKKETLFIIIKQKGSCAGIDCFDCGFYTKNFRCKCDELIEKKRSKNRFRYKIVVKEYIEKYGEIDLVESLL
jgi:hypothetical protein